MKRKVVKQGHNAMTITLPASWIKEQNISPGNELDINIRGKDLIIKKDFDAGGDKITFQMHGKSDYLHRHLGVLYRLGYDEIKVEFDDPSMVDKIQLEIETMPGFEMFDQGENFCIIKNIATGLEKEFDNILRKIFLNIMHCGNQSLVFIKNNQLKSLESLKQLHKVNNRLPNFCQRMLKKEGFKEHRKTILVYAMVWSLEQVGDYYNNIFVYLLDLKKQPKITQEILELYEKTNNLIEEYYKLFYSFDSYKVSDLKIKCLNTINKMRESLEKKTGPDSILLLNLNLITERIYHMTESLI